jgi:hypothetical protein
MAATTKEMPSLELINEWLYLGIDNKLYWRKSPANAHPAGKIFGTLHKDVKKGKKRIRGKLPTYGTVYAHRIIYQIHNPYDSLLPSDEIDHINGDSLNNAKHNLRKVSLKVNHQNKLIPITNTSGVMGVTWDKNKLKWRTEVRWRDSNNIRQRKFLGYFDSIHEAAEVRRIALAELGFHPNHGRTK